MTALNSVISCGNFPHVTCCDSCHEDCDAGYGELMELEFAGGKGLVCCAIIRYLDKKEKP